MSPNKLITEALKDCWLQKFWRLKYKKLLETVFLMSYTPEERFLR
jgi:hypothetical protein